MPAGTITLTNNSATVTGSGTSFTTEPKANDFIVAVVGGVTYTLGVQSVNSATSVTLTTAYGGPTTSGLAWNAVANAALVGITAQVAADVAKAIRGLNLDKANWQQVYSASGNITVTLPDGSQYSGPSWNSVVNSVSGKMDKSQNLSDLADKPTARFNLGWVNGALPISLGGTGATDAGTARANLLNNAINWELMNTEMRRYAFAAGRQNANLQGAGVWSFNNTPFGYNEQYGLCIQVNNRSDSSGAAGTGVWQHYLALCTSGNILYVTNINGIYSARKLYSTSR
ncbi:hypothetical protein [Pantoea sp.]|uniref:hypothetical protein n=1 Tax=Pantoea sp. TaxID=69393 RepID=UPI0028A6E9D6|nr:hypothetical protein [Pantoea sp.]